MINLGNITIKDLRFGTTQIKNVYLGNVQIWGGEEPPVPTADWLCFTAEQANSTVHLDKAGSPGAIYLETSTDGSTWTDYSWTDKTGDTLTLASIGDKVYMRAKTENQTIGDSSNYYKFKMTGKIAASGNIQTLLKADGSRTDAPAYCYRSIFTSCSSLTTAPELPATTLARNCYDSMFVSCTSLTTAPALPATTLAQSCYYYMFYGCTSLTTAPELPATTLAPSCYNYMFQRCSSLNSVEVAFTSWFYQGGMFTVSWLSNVAASGTFICPAALPDERGASNIPEGWTKVDAA